LFTKRGNWKYLVIMRRAETDSRLLVLCSRVSVAITLEFYVWVTRCGTTRIVCEIVETKAT
jgi:hypothetical protein